MTIPGGSTLPKWVQYLLAFIGPFLTFSIFGWGVSLLWSAAVGIGLIVGIIAGAACTGVIWLANNGRGL